MTNLTITHSGIEVDEAQALDLVRGVGNRAAATFKIGTGHATQDEAKAVVALFAKTAKVKVVRHSDVNDEGQPYADWLVLVWTWPLKATTTGERNETGERRIRSVFRTIREEA